jgi:hypothetical protein
MSISANRSPPFIDLQNPQLGLIANIIAKYKILIYNLLFNSAEARNTPFNSPIILAC